jgi:hypothetical protein
MACKRLSRPMCTIIIAYNAVMGLEALKQHDLFILLLMIIVGTSCFMLNIRQFCYVISLSCEAQ